MKRTVKNREKTKKIAKLVHWAGIRGVVICAVSCAVRCAVFYAVFYAVFQRVMRTCRVVMGIHSRKDVSDG